MRSDEIPETYDTINVPIDLLIAFTININQYYYQLCCFT